MRVLLAFILVLAGVRGEVIDRIAVSVGNQVITENQIEEEVRVTAFQNMSVLSMTPAEKKKAAERLIEQTLVKHEMEISRYPLPQRADAAGQLAEIKANLGAQYQEKLAQYGIDEAALERHLLWQLALLRFIDYRFRPGIQLPEQDVREAYDKQAAKWKEEGRPIPSFDEARPKLEQALVEQRTDQALDRWLGDTRTQVEIRFHEGAFE
ncbi:MAG TPA: hypothetical protein VKG25_09695 [Bryobacteraceae bacterium]|nr:hypothetical protein [Bryobacteraceae bacterium]